MKIRRITGLVAASAATALVLAACSPSEDGDDDANGDDTTNEEAGSDDGGDSGEGGGDAEGLNESTQVNVGWNQAFYEYNDSSATGNATANANITYHTRQEFFYYDENLALVPNEEYGSAEVTSEDPLVIEYTVNEGQTWSDGTPVTAVDTLLEWAATSAHFNTAEVELDEEGIANEEELEGQVAFSGTSPTVGYISEVPEISEDLMTLTVTYDRPFSDWQTNLQPGVPAHVVAQHALDIEDPQEALDEVVRVIQEGDTEALSAMSEFWNTGFAFSDTLGDDPSIYLANGPYVLSELNGEEYVTLERNEEYSGEREAPFDLLTIRFNNDPGAQVTALQNEEIALMSPQATADLLTTIEGLGEPYEYTQADTATYEHIDFIMNNGGPFDAAAYDGDEETARMVREAFMRLIPRQQILDSLIIPLNPEAVVRDSYTQVPGSPGYEVVTESNGLAGEFLEADAEAAGALLDEAGVETPIDVRVMYDSTNTRRSQTIELLAATLDESGLFTLNDVGSADWGTLLSDSSLYDASLFGWQSTSTAVSDSQANFVEGGINNFGGYANAEVADLYDQLSTETDEQAQYELMAQIEAQLVEDAFGITLYQHPGVTAWNSDVVSGIAPITISPTIFWNFWEWTPGSAAAAN
ncbi:MAG: ABC transporter family substrate-binding protein [Actinomycetaceae bacterium]